MIFLDYIFAARPLLHLPVWSIYLVSLHYHHTLSYEKFSLVDLLMLAALTLAAAGSYYINQIYDYGSDLLNNKLGFLQRKQISEKGMMMAFYATSIAAVLIGGWLSKTSGLLILILVVLGYYYSAPPFRLKDRMLLGLFANAFGFGFLISIAVLPDMTRHNGGLIWWDLPLYFACTVGAVYLLTTLPDSEGDRVVGKKTAAVLLPSIVVKISALLFLSLSVYVAFYSEVYTLVLISFVSVFPVLISIFSKSKKVELFAIKFPILLLTVLAGHFFFWFYIFVVALLIATRIYYKKRYKMVYPKLS